MELLPIPATEIPLGSPVGQEMEIPMGQHLSCSGIPRFNPPVLLFCLSAAFGRVSPPFHHTLKQPNHLLRSRAGLQGSFPGSSPKFTFFPS